MDDSTAAAIMMWKEHTYAPTDIPFTEAVDSLILDDPLIYARQSDTRKSDWVVSSSTQGNMRLCGADAYSQCMLDMPYRNHDSSDFCVCWRVFGR